MVLGFGSSEVVSLGCAANVVTPAVRFGDGFSDPWVHPCSADIRWGAGLAAAALPRATGRGPRVFLFFSFGQWRHLKRCADSPAVPAILPGDMPSVCLSQSIYLQVHPSAVPLKGSSDVQRLDMRSQTAP